MPASFSLSLFFLWGGGGTKQEGGPNLTDDEKEKASKRKKGGECASLFSFLFFLCVVSERRRTTTTCGDAKSFLVTIGNLGCSSPIACMRSSTSFLANALDGRGHFLSWQQEVRSPHEQLESPSLPHGPGAVPASYLLLFFCFRYWQWHVTPQWPSHTVFKKIIIINGRELFIEENRKQKGLPNIRGGGGDGEEGDGFCMCYFSLWSLR